METEHFDKNGRKVRLGDWVWFDDPNFYQRGLPGRGLIVKINDDGSATLVNSDGYYDRHSKLVTEFNVCLTNIEK